MTYHLQRCPTRPAPPIGTWSGGRFMHFGEPLDDERLIALLRPGRRHPHGDHRRRLRRRRGGRAARPRARRACRATLLPGRRDRPRLLRGRARGREGLPALHRPAPARPGRLRGLPADGDRGSLERIGADAFDLLLLHNPDRTGYTSRGGVGGDGGAARRRASRAGSASRPARPTASRSTCSTASSASARCIDWAMIILNPLEPWPGELVLEAAATTTCG